ncbi:MAG: 23S rRNA (adenine(2503)-C(2))-methyltransferase RlmN [Heliobacteriaceae bacterium]|nr:23S rRNA (adenine(2503)-C(2))-methyltransferase RlmN [Heliobacteriaceae bacterium]
MSDLRGMLPAEIAAAVAAWGWPAYRGNQIFRGLQKRGVRALDELTDLPVDLRGQLATSGKLRPLRVKRRQIAGDRTEKVLWELADGELLETVLMPYERSRTRDRVTVCLSTQVGCALACRFCATGQQGFRRNLTPAEIVGQVLDLTAEKRLAKPDFKVTNLVFMGMGEPLLNFAAVRQAIRILTHPQGQAIGQRRITVSTVGIVPGIEQFTAEGWEVNLALSLHATDDRQRSELMPVNRRYPLAAVLAACRNYWRQTRRRLTVEYALIKGFNDSLADARRLAAMFAGWPVHVNVIPVNPVAESGWVRPSPDAVKCFLATLKKAGITAVLREERGGDIMAACGQLRGTVVAERGVSHEGNRAHGCGPGSSEE